VAIGNGSVEAARRFHLGQQVNFPLYTDPSLRSFDAAGLKRGLISTLKPKVALAAVTALREGFSQTATEGNVLQQGGAFVLDRGGAQRFAFVSDAAGDHPDPEALVAALP
jgi:hypothetical protein